MTNVQMGAPRPDGGRSPAQEGLLGAHQSVAGGLEKAFERIQRVGGTALQVFTRNQRQWETAPISPVEAAAFARAWREWGAYPVFSHASYLLNLASPDPEARQRSVKALTQELVRCRELCIPYVVLHPGAALGADRSQALKFVAAGADMALDACGADGPDILLENVAGQGTYLGARFEELARIMDLARQKDRLGLCFDTCHALAAGHDLRDPLSFEHTLAELDRQIGLDRLRLVHMNDSKHPLGSAKDRHEHIGQGAIGLEGFRLLMNDTRLLQVPKVLETHKDKDLRQDAANLAVLRSLVRP